MARRTEKQTEALIEKQMKLLDISYEEAKELVQYDDDVDRGKIKDNLTPEQKKVIRQVTRADSNPTKAKRTVKRERKVDEDKKHLIDLLAASLDGVENLSVKNEAEIAFTYKESEYVVKLTKHRKKD